ncbi:hypothetical protein PTTG_05111 [Puccinia triticina 1-1 BBBD Race 1]|uniref:Uncharacterized protein n=2 Tax=Puccinia triticina TaxID=208348 RepID=A0A180GFU3_PUCT1|nr:uncharacterized protein PtA15_17A320 [Puccinia triticina]OAV91444.1 hypothetical protein PTTG_05111 [Puccinia triticina 1-1 BBBD Race 1]WAQ92838.1 hypothetical protein PtA15_17A320 [Puccinia triticina]WAR63735.1 hypothetical protein PtB15_17B336 [Puccinia triticina]
MRRATNHDQLQGGLRHTPHQPHCRHPRAPHECRVTGDGIQPSQHGMSSHVQIEGRSDRTQIAQDLNISHLKRLRIPPGLKHERQRIPTVQLERTPASESELGAKRISPYIPRHSRTALSPCLSPPSRIISSISRLGPGGCTKILSKIGQPGVVHHPVLNSSDENVDLQTKVYNLSPSWCSPNLRKSAHRYVVSDGEYQNPDNEILAGFLKNNGGYLDDSDDEQEELEEQDTPGNTMMATLNFLKRRIQYPFEFRSPRYTQPSSSQASYSSTSFSNSTRTISAYSTNSSLSVDQSHDDQIYKPPSTPRGISGFRYGYSSG